MTPSYVENDAGGSADASAAEVARELHRYMVDAAARPTNDRICEIVDRLCFARSETAADALAVSTWLDSFLVVALAQIPEAEAGSTENPRFLIALARVMAQKAIKALEATTGMAAESFDCERRTAN